MRKAILAGALGLMMGAGLLATQSATAYDGDGCSGASIGGTPIHGPGGDEIVCADGLGAPIDGGAIIVGLTQNNGPTRVCAGPVEQDTSLITVGVYLGIDGDNANEDPLDGYAAISNYESGGSNENCTQGNDGAGGSTNSGGSFGADAAPGVNLPLPFACGNDSGENFNSSSRDGCYNP